MQLFKRIGTGLLVALVWAGILAGLALTIVPRFLDRIYYAGAESDHYDGARFFNPDGDDMALSPDGGSRLGFAWRMLTGLDDRPDWPQRVAVQTGYPDAALIPCPATRGGAVVENWRRCTVGPLDPRAMSATWVGHATVLVQTAGFAMLTDPTWSETAGPFGIGPARVTQPGIAFDALPKIDLIVVSHNHYDHMDIPTLRALWERDQPLILTTLGNAAILRDAGIPAEALDWGQRRRTGRATVHVTRNHHWSSRWGTDRNRALWASFVVDTPAGRVFFAGDTGFGDGTWANEAARIPALDGGVPPIRLAILPIGAFRFRPGQMDVGSHIGPAQAIDIWNRLGRPQTVGIHWGTFRLSSEAYDTPPRMLNLLMHCAVPTAADRFTNWRIGALHRIAPVGDSPPPLEIRQLAACAARPDVRALP